MTKRARQLQQALSALVLAADRLYEHQRHAPGDAAALARLALDVERASMPLSSALAAAVAFEIARPQTEILNELAAFD